MIELSKCKNRREAQGRIALWRDPGRVPASGDELLPISNRSVAAYVTRIYTNRRSCPLFLFFHKAPHSFCNITRNMASTAFRTFSVFFILLQSAICVPQGELARAPPVCTYVT